MRPRILAQGSGSREFRDGRPFPGIRAACSSPPDRGFSTILGPGETERPPAHEQDGMDSPEISLSNESLLEHATWVRKLAFELVRDPGTADDLAQETWLAFLRARPDTERPLLGSGGPRLGMHYYCVLSRAEFPRDRASMPKIPPLKKSHPLSKRHAISGTAIIRCCHGVLVALEEAHRRRVRLRCLHNFLDSPV